jgi:hypothetical protein
MLPLTATLVIFILMLEITSIRIWEKSVNRFKTTLHTC